MERVTLDYSCRNYVVRHLSGHAWSNTGVGRLIRHAYLCSNVVHAGDSLNLSGLSTHSTGKPSRCHVLSDGAHVYFEAIHFEILPDSLCLLLAKTIAST